MVNLPRKVFIRAYEFLVKKKRNIHHQLCLKKYSNAFILQEKKILHRMTQWVTGTLTAL